MLMLLLLLLLLLQAPPALLLPRILLLLLLLMLPLLPSPRPRRPCARQWTTQTTATRRSRPAVAAAGAARARVAAMGAPPTPRRGPRKRPRVARARTRVKPNHTHAWIASSTPRAPRGRAAWRFSLQTFSRVLVFSSLVVGELWRSSARPYLTRCFRLRTVASITEQDDVVVEVRTCACLAV